MQEITQQDIMARFRFHLSREEYAEAEDAWRRLVERLEPRLRKGNFPPQEWAPVAALYDWSRSVLLCARARMADQLNASHVASRYGSPAEASTRHIRTNL